MAKHASGFELILPPRDAAMPAYRWLYESIRAGILQGRLRQGARLPATRELGRLYGLSRGTIISAFDQLTAEGYLEGRTGSGTYVSAVLPEAMFQAPRLKQRASTSSLKTTMHLSEYGKRAELFQTYEARPMRAFRANLPALDLFPVDLWAQLQAKVLRKASTNLLMGCDPLGFPPLRRAIADYLSTSRGARCDWQQVAIVSGVQEALDITTRLLVEPGETICMEDPGYPGASAIFRAYGADVVPVPVDKDGLEVKRLPRKAVRLLYVTPGHQFPLGVTLSLARRLELLEWASNSGALIFEDDYDSEFRFVGRPLPALQGLDRSDSVLFAGSFSKVLFPGLRLGYLVVPSRLRDRLEAAKSIINRHTPTLEQAVLCAFIEEGHFGRHIRRMRNIYAERCSLLIEESRKHLGNLLEFPNPHGGLQTAAWLASSFQADEVLRAAAKHNVELSPLSRYGAGRLPWQGFQVGFAALHPLEIRRGIERLVAAFEDVGLSKPKKTRPKS